MFEYWFMFPLAIIIATVAMSTLVGGATFFSPLFILILGLEPRVGIAVALITQFFGFGTGLIKYIKKGTIDYNIGFVLLIVTIPYAIIGSFLITKLNPYTIKIFLGLIMIYIGFNLFNHGEMPIMKNGKKLTFIKFKKNTTKNINMTNKEMGKNLFLTSIGSLFLGMTSAGLGELLGFRWIKKSNANMQTIVSTTVFIIAITTFVTSITHFYNLLQNNIEGLIIAKKILIFTVPGVIIGANIGTHIISIINPEKLQKMVSVFLIVAGIIFFIPL